MLPFALTCAAPVEVTWNAEPVKVVVTYPQSVYADHISLLKVGGEWRIVNKIHSAKQK